MIMKSYDFDNRQFKANLNNAFKALRKEGYWARQNWQCCQSCGWAAVPDEKSEMAVFYHAQDAAQLKDRNPRVYLAWAGNGTKINSILQQFVDVEWDGTDNSRFLCTPK